MNAHVERYPVGIQTLAVSKLCQVAVILLEWTVTVYQNQSGFDWL